MICNDQVHHLNTIENAFQMLNVYLCIKCSKSKQELKIAAVMAWQSITNEETQCLVMTMDTRFQAVTDCKKNV